MQDDHIERYGDPMSFDYEGFFENEPGPLDDGVDEIQLRQLGYFCREVFAGRTPPDWLLKRLAYRIYPVVMGGEWEDAFHLPWTKWETKYSRRGDRAIRIYFHVEWFRVNKPERNITDVIQEFADEYYVSYETARADYYSIRNAVEKKIDVPTWVYKKGLYKNSFLFSE
ncbi:hypothetical protein GSY71_01225 [Pusillimonas sp. TS35]|nr:hypothetical protein [Pusillimonas sp. TS35]